MNWKDKEGDLHGPEFAEREWGKHESTRQDSTNHDRVLNTGSPVHKMLDTYLQQINVGTINYKMTKEVTGEHDLHVAYKWIRFETPCI
jgi:hypothetical protein